MSKPMMQAIRVHEFGAPEQLQLENIPIPEPGAGEVLLRVHAAGVPPADCKRRQGFFKGMNAVDLPYIPGSAVAGIVEAIGSGVTTFQKGQAVFGRSVKGAYAEYVTPAAVNLALKPDHLSFAAAATISGGATVAWTALFENADLQPGQTVLIHGGVGGVGLFAVQFAKWKGARVIATASTANVDFVRALGADEVIDYTITPFETIVHDMDVVLETIGGENLERSMQVVKPGGLLISLLEPPSQERAGALGIRAITNSVTQPYPSTQLLTTIAQLMAEGVFKTAVAKEFSLADAPNAHRLCETGHGRGRIVLHITD